MPCVPEVSTQGGRAESGFQGRKKERYTLNYIYYEFIFDLIWQLTLAAKKSRWGDESDKATVVSGQVVEGKSPQLVAYAIKVFGSVDLEPHQWKQCEDQMKVLRCAYQQSSL